VRILLVTNNYPPKIGGMENMLYQLVSHWQKEHSIIVLGPYGTGHDSDSAATVFRPKIKGLLWFFAAALKNSLAKLKGETFDIVLAGSALVLPLATILGRMFKAPMVTQVHGLDLTYPNKIYQMVVKRLLPFSILVVANSANTARIAIELGLPEKNITVVNPGLDFAEFAALPDRQTAKARHEFQGKKVILSAGRLAPRKGIPEFIERVLPGLLESHPDLLFVVAGDNPTDSLAHKEDVLSRIHEATRRIKGGEHVRTLGRVPRKKLLELYAAADVFVLPAIETSDDVEGFGIVLIEAGAARCPVVSTRHGGIPDAVVDGGTGVLVSPGDWKAMAEALSHLLTAPEFGAAMGEEGRKRAEHQHDWSVVGRKYIQVVSHLSI
jgi:phosphatidylinositol alpha-1,6-mannosyltransferase